LGLCPRGSGGQQLYKQGNNRVGSIFKRCQGWIAVWKNWRQGEQEAAEIAKIKTIIAYTYQCPRHRSNLVVSSANLKASPEATMGGMGRRN
jgi:hypothetical protein